MGMLKILKKVWRWIVGWIRAHTAKFIILLLSATIIFAYLWPHIMIFIKPGEAGVIWRRFGGGTVTDRYYDEGTHVILPWDKMYIYDMRTQQVTDSVSVLSVNGLMITLEMSIRYRPNHQIVGFLHKEVGPNYVNVVIIPEIEAVVRTIIGKYTPEEIYQSQSAISEQIVKESFVQVEERYINLDDVLIKRITLPDKIKSAIEEKLEQQQMAQAYEYRLQRESKEAERKRIEAEGISRYNALINSTLTGEILTWQGIVATKELANSQNSKVIVIGAGDKGLPLILGNN
jgi:regulator of protease activity HflC (stomatin/prohibitin superfamily)